MLLSGSGDQQKHLPLPSPNQRHQIIKWTHAIFMFNTACNLKPWQTSRITQSLSGKWHRQDNWTTPKCHKLSTRAFYRTLLIEGAEGSVGRYWWSESATGLIYMDSSATLRPIPILKLNICFSLLSFQYFMQQKQCQQNQGVTKRGCWLNVHQQAEHNMNSSSNQIPISFITKKIQYLLSKNILRKSILL